MDFQQTLDELNIVLGDSGDVTFTPEEKERALTKAWNDPYVIRQVTDSTQTFSTSTANYTIPATMTSVTGVYISTSNSATSFPEEVGGDVWTQRGTTLSFGPNASRYITSGYTLYIRGNYKLNPSTDTLDTVDLQEYVISLAAYNTLALLGHKKANLFLKNDLTVAELIALKREFRQDVAEGRARLTKAWESF